MRDLMKIQASRREEWGAAAGVALSALLLYAVFPPLEWTWAAWIALVPLLVVARRSLGRPLRLGWLAGFVFWLLSIRWLTNVTVAGWILLSAYCALFFVPVTRLSRRWQGGGLGFAFAVAVVWSGSEFVRGWLGTGFPWNTLGAGLTPWLPAIQLAELGGVWLVSGLAAFANALVAWAVTERRDWKGLAVGAALVALAVGWGAWRLGRLPDPGRTLRVALVQTAIPQDEKWVESKVEMIYERLDELTRQAQSRDPLPDLVIWPETALPDDVRNSLRSFEVVNELVRGGTPIMAGSLDIAMMADYPPLFYNSAFLFDTDGRIAGEYDKRHLVVFGEYVPFERWIPGAVHLALGLPLSITPGTTSVRFHVDPGEVPLAPLICFEDIMPYLARSDVRSGARVLVNITNDAWFDDAVAPNQHMRNAVLRAVENRVPLVRAANTGISCVIGPSGRVLARLADEGGRTWMPGVLHADVPVPPDGMSLTFYTRFGDMYGWACASAAMLWLVAALRPRRKRPGIL